MELAIRDGRAIWINKDGSSSKKEVSLKAILAFKGFPEVAGPRGGVSVPVAVIAGDPLKDRVILVHEDTWVEPFLLSKNTKKYIRVTENIRDCVENILKDPPSSVRSLTKMIEKAKHTEMLARRFSIY